MFVSFEGVDGSGKSTQAQLLREWLEGLGRGVVACREPGGTALGERIRDLLLAGAAMAPWAEAALFAAARAELVAEVIRPALARGEHVVCDRYVDSSLAYQGVARGLGVERVLQLNLIATEALLPDRTFLLLIDPVEARRRAGAEGDRIEREGSAFQHAVDRGYRDLADRFRERVVAVDAARAPGAIASIVRGELRDLA
ncbi:MAG: dTMP kinase [Thermoleophilia bacterium]|nr:dTMP kinase [Thermoleophilia bacterium]